MDDAQRSEDKIGAGPLFSRSASENAEVVAGGATRHDAGLWTISAKDPEDVDRGTPVEDRSGGDFWDDGDGDDLWDLIEDDDDPRVTAFPPPPFGQPYRSPLAGREGSGGDSDDGGSGRWSGWPVGQPDPHGDREVVDPLTPQDAQTVGPDDQVGADMFAEPDLDEEVLEGSIIDDSFEEDQYEDQYEDHVGDPGDPVSDAGDYRYADEGIGGADTHASYEYADAADATDSIYDTVGSLFRSEPVERNRDVIDSPDDQDVDPLEDITGGASPFSSGSPFGHRDSFNAPTSSPGPDPDDGPPFAPGSGGVASGRGVTSNQHDDVVEVVGEADTPGFLRAIEALDPSDRSRTRTALVVVGALLGVDEEVLGLVVGQMLGHPAALVLTRDRIMVVNDRPWQPVVDQYALDEELEIRGRHDRNVAAIGLGDGDQLSMVDGVRDVRAAVEIVDRVRSMTGLD